MGNTIYGVAVLTIFYIMEGLQKMTLKSIALGIGAFFVAFLLIGTAMSIVQAVQGSTNEAVPSCQEDELVVGIGDFDDGFWDEYICIHPDTIING